MQRRATCIVASRRGGAVTHMLQRVLSDIDQSHKPTLIAVTSRILTKQMVLLVRYIP